MGACGCGDGFGRQFPGPKGIVYELTVYNGCSDCDTPAGFFIRRIRKADCDYLDAMDPLEFNEANDFAQAMACPRRVLAKVSELLRGVKVLDPDSGLREPEPFREYVEIVRDELLGAVREGIAETIGRGSYDDEKGSPDEG